VQKVEVHHAGEWKCHLANTDVQELNMTRSDILKNIVLQDFLPYLAPVIFVFARGVDPCISNSVSSPRSSLDLTNLRIRIPPSLLQTGA
jgi:hypothetical protein